MKIEKKVLDMSLAGIFTAITALHMFPLYPPIVTNGLNTKEVTPGVMVAFSRLVLQEV